MPIYTYRCEQGHEWDEVRTIEGSEFSADPCATCLETIDRLGFELDNTGEPGTEDLSEFAGRKVPAPVSVKFRGKGWTPTHYTNRKENK